VAGTPDLAQIGAILHGAGEVGTGGGERAIGAVAAQDQQAWTAAETENLSRIRRQVPDLGGHNLVPAEVDYRRRDKIAQHGIEKRSQGGE